MQIRVYKHELLLNGQSTLVCCIYMSEGYCFVLLCKLGWVQQTRVPLQTYKKCRIVQLSPTYTCVCNTQTRGGADNLSETAVTIIFIYQQVLSWLFQAETSIHTNVLHFANNFEILKLFSQYNQSLARLMNVTSNQSLTYH